MAQLLDEIHTVNDKQKKFILAFKLSCRVMGCQTDGKRRESFSNIGSQVDDRGVCSILLLCRSLVFAPLWTF